MFRSVLMIVTVVACAVAQLRPMNSLVLSTGPNGWFVAFRLYTEEVVGSSRSPEYYIYRETVSTTVRLDTLWLLGEDISPAIHIYSITITRGEGQVLSLFSWHDDIDSALWRTAVCSPPSAGVLLQRNVLAVNDSMCEARGEDWPYSFSFKICRALATPPIPSAAFNLDTACVLIPGDVVEMMFASPPRDPTQIKSIDRTLRVSPQQNTSPMSVDISGRMLSRQQAHHHQRVIAIPQ